MKNYVSEKRLLSIKELAQVYGCTMWFWRCRIWAKELPVVKVGRKQFVDRKDLDKFIDSHKV